MNWECVLAGGHCALDATNLFTQKILTHLRGTCSLIKQRTKLITKQKMSKLINKEKINMNIFYKCLC